jgi:plasmid stabilization system protein ParE
MPFDLKWSPRALAEYEAIAAAAQRSLHSRKCSRKTKASAQERLFKQITKTLGLLGANPRHPSLNTHEYSSLPHPFDPDQKVFEAYAQNNTPGAYRVFWCYGPQKGQITILAITLHP